MDSPRSDSAPAPATRSGGLAGATTALLALLAATGVVLVALVPPTTAAGFDLVDLEAASRFALVPGLHRWGSHLVVAAVFLRLVRVFLAGGHRHAAAWRRGVALLALVAALAMTGSVLSWQPATRASTAEAARLAGLAPPGERSLGLVFALHALVLPLLLGGLVAAERRGGRGATR